MMQSSPAAKSSQEIALSRSADNHGRASSVESNSEAGDERWARSQMASQAEAYERRTVLVTDYAWPSLDIERRILAEVNCDLVAAETGEPDEVVELASGSDAIMTNWKRVPPEALDSASNCVIVARYGVGLDNIPVARATELGIVVANVPDFCLNEVSDHTMALLLACARRVVLFARATRQGSWDFSAGQGIRRLRGETLGLVGYGNIARSVVPKAHAFGLHVLVYTPRLPRGRVADGSEATDDLGELLAQADYVSIHAPASPDTEGLFGAREFAQMKPTAFLINTSRGALIEEAALVSALDEGRIAGAALDVLSSEPPPPGHPLLSRDDVIVTPHTAFYSLSAIEELQTKTAQNVVAALQGKVPTTIVNREVLSRPECRLGTRHAS